MQEIERKRIKWLKAKVKVKRGVPFIGELKELKSRVKKGVFDRRTKEYEAARA